jgi:Phosphoserine phosphatase RsbU, N-terminal domain
MSADMRRITQDYRAALLRFLPRRDEAALHTGYEIGRAALADGVSVLDLVRIHHDVLTEVLRESTASDRADTTTTAGDFFVQVLAPYDMAFRVRPDHSGGGRRRASTT